MSTITSLTGTDGITSANSMTKINTNFSNLNTDKIETSVIDTDTALALNSDSKLPSQKAVKAYVDTLGNVNASETARGIVEEATDAEVTAGTATGGTTAKLFVTPAKLATRLAASGYSLVELNTTQNTLAADSTETTVYTKSLTAGFFTTTNGIKIRGQAQIATRWVSGAAKNVTIKVKLGGTAVATIVVAPPAVSGGTGTNPTMIGFWEVLILNNASTSAQKYAYHSTFVASSADFASDTVVSVAYAQDNDEGVGTSAIDVSGTISLTVTYQNSEANAGTNFTHDAIILEKVG